jgi:hypothetical protein
MNVNLNFAKHVLITSFPECIIAQDAINVASNMTIIAE